METLFWSVLGLFLLYLWLKGHWFGWVVAWPAILAAWSVFDPPIIMAGGFRWDRLFFAGAIAGVPMALRAVQKIIVIGRGREADERAISPDRYQQQPPTTRPPSQSAPITENPVATVFGLSFVITWGLLPVIYSTNPISGLNLTTGPDITYILDFK